MYHNCGSFIIDYLILFIGDLIGNENFHVDTMYEFYVAILLHNNKSKLVPLVENIY